MSFTDKKIKVTAFQTSEPLPLSSEMLPVLRSAEQVFRDSRIEMLQGIWIGSGKVIMDKSLSANNCLIGEDLYFAICKMEPKIDRNLLKAEIQREEASYLLANGAEFVPRTVKKEIRDDVTIQLQMKAPKVLKITEVMIHESTVYIGSTSPNDCDLVDWVFAQLFHISLVHISPLSWLGDKAETTDIGGEFLTWLLWRQEQCSVNYLLEGKMTFCARTADEEHAKCTAIVAQGENILESSEVRSALDSGKLICKTSFAFTDEDDCWSGAIDAGNWSFSALKLPESDEMTSDEILIEKFLLLDRLYELFRNEFDLFIKSYSIAGYQERKADWLLNR